MSTSAPTAATFRRRAADEHAVRRVEVQVNGFRHPVTTAPVISQSGVMEYVLLARWVSMAVATSMASSKLLTFVVRVRLLGTL